MNRRDFTLFSGASLLAAAMPFSLDAQKSRGSLIKKSIPATAELITAIGMGSWHTFDVSGTEQELQIRTEILRLFFEQGGQFIDSSPMYGSSEKIIGQCLKNLEGSKSLFSATKIWTEGEDKGIAQMQRSQKLWGVEQFDLMQIHNLRDWNTHLKTLRRWKELERVRYIGVTTSHGLRHDQLIQVLKKEKPDFVQLTYNINDREVETRLLPLAQDLGIAVIVNRPFTGLFGRVKDKPLPDYAKEFDCYSWAQFFLKFVISHPAVTCAIPATSKIKHMYDNMQAAKGVLPDLKQRQQMLTSFETL
ncbi:MAG: aldo/keto reductase [Kangiellaceae bacterium]|nr:aldo/keto reductase [Kangiellaceae bacterium]